MFKVNGIPAIGVSKHRALLFTNKHPGKMKDFQFVRGNKLLSMVLVETKKDLEYIKLTPTDKFLNADEVAVITKSKYTIGNVKRRQIAFNFATFTEPTPKGSVVGIKCYSSVGLGVGENKFVETRYVKFFLETDPFMYGDIGARFADEIEEPIVYLTDPYRKGIEFKPGDLITEIDGKKVESSLEVQDIIMFAKPGEFLKVKFLRNGRPVEKEIEVYKLLGDSFDNETFLERFGLVFDENLNIIKIKKGSLAEKKRLKIGDTLKQVENIEVFRPAEVARLLSQTKKIDGKFIFEREKFQFFIELAEE